MISENASEFGKVVVLLAAGVIGVPLFRRLGLGSVLGYLAAGLVIGPFGLAVFGSPQHILHVAELGVVMFLFVIGLEMQPARLWSLRRVIFGLGLIQVLVCAGLLMGLGMWWLDLAPPVAFVAAMGFVLTSTAIVMQLSDEAGITATPRGQRIVAILLFEDLAIVPLLAVVALLSPLHGEEPVGSRWTAVGLALVAVVGLVAVSRWLLNPLFRWLARSNAREVMTAAALLVVLSAALAMEWGGLSMAMGAFAAGVMLSESAFRHQLEADIEPFRGMLLGLFFMSVGMSLDVTLVQQEWRPILIGVVAFMVLKALGIFAVARFTGQGRAHALERAALMAQGGEFAFVLFATALTEGVIDDVMNARLTAAIILSMALTPLVVAAARRLPVPEPMVDMAGVDEAKDLTGSVLVIGFGRFGQIASGALLARGMDTVIIERDTDMIRSAAHFGFKVYYGDGRRTDVLHASGAGGARAILVCVDTRETVDEIVQTVRREFPLTPLLVRAFDRQHATALVRQGVAYQMRETYESALAFGAAALTHLGVPPEEAEDIAQHMRRLDAERLALEVLGRQDDADALLKARRWSPTPLTTPQQTGAALNAEAERALGSPTDR